MKRLLISFIFFAHLNFLSICVFSQNIFPIDYFRSPMDIPIRLTGNFGELRKNHFHSGIDIRTNGTTGKNIYAIADGFIARVIVKSKGYGNAIYINHPNGYTSVYAHLECFKDEISKYVRDSQYESKKHEIELYFSPAEFPVKKGDIIALSGNSGYSGGPHLHFEIRDTKTDNPLNAMLFQFNIKDDLKPIPKFVYVYPVGKQGSVEHKTEKIKYNIIGSDGKYRISPNIINVSGEIAFGISANDYLNYSHFKCGIYSIELLVDDKTIYYHELKRFSFDRTKALNSLVDYEEYVKNKVWVFKSYIRPNSSLEIYKKQLGNGSFNFDKNKIYKVKYILSDAYNNISNIEFNVKGTEISDKNKIKQPANKSVFAVLPYQKRNYYFRDDVKVTLPKGILFDTLFFEYATTKGISGSYSSIHKIHNIYTPIFDDFILEIKGNRIPEKYRNKAVIVRIRKDGKKAALVSKWTDGFVVAEPSSFGSFVLMIDTVAPSIIPINFKKNGDLSQTSKIRFKIRDKLSDIKFYNGYIDKKWVLFEFDLKKDELSYDFHNSDITGGEHDLLIKVTDDMNNKAVYKAKYIR